MNKLVSIVIPTYEEEGIAARLDALAAHLRKERARDFEIVIVDDSAVENRERIRTYARDHENVTLVDGENRGKGHAVKLGILATHGDVVFTIDADLPVALERNEEFLRWIDEGYDVVVGERPIDRNVKNPVRFVASRVLFFVQRFIVFGGSNQFLDTQCGFKAFRGDVARSLAKKQIVDGGMYDIEYLFIATSENRRIARVAVTQLPSPRPSKIRTFEALVRDPKDLARIKLHARRGGY